jgi:hypothetical protein
MFLANAQELAVLTSIEQKKSGTMISKLCLGVRAPPRRPISTAPSHG